MAKYFSGPCPMKCPKCGHGFEVDLALVETDPDLTCPSCGVDFHVNAQQFTETLGEAEKALDDFKDSFGKLGE